MRIKEHFHLAFKTYTPETADYMHMDFLDRRIAVVGGGGLCVWAIQMSQFNGETKFSLFEVPIPKSQVTAVNKPPDTMQLRTVHFLPQKDSVIVSFVGEDVGCTISQL
jgi:hypothetical protein